jgi:uncharacterized membrane protein YphA (DoxX/SURF4 family)
MTISAKLRRAPGRIATGAFILNSGLGKFNGDDETAKRVHSMAAGAYPACGKVPPKPFLKLLATGEIALGTALLLPIVPAGLAGIGLLGFSGSLLGMWWRTPGMHHEGSPRPTQQGTAIAKDSWMLAIGIGLVIDAALGESRVTGVESRARARATVRADAKAAQREARRQVRRARRRMADALPG